MKRALLLIFLLPSPSWALPIDWHGVFGAGTTSISNFRSATRPQDGQDSDASFQTAIFRLSPEVIINDMASLFAEFNLGQGRGWKVGDHAAEVKGHRYFDGTSRLPPLSVSQLYVDLYSDTTTYRIGRFSRHWGLGAIVHGGKGPWDYFSFTQDGIELTFRLGHFDFRPFWARANAQAPKDPFTDGERIREYGISVLYDNPVSDFAFGILHEIKEAGAHRKGLERAEVKLIDLYLKKVLGKFTLAAELPLLDGSLGPSKKYQARAFLGEAQYMASSAWAFHFNLGAVTGGRPEGRLGDLYLHPNYQVAELLFRYNLEQEGAPYYDSSIHNALFAKLMARYLTGRWDLGLSLIRAQAHSAGLSPPHLKGQEEDPGPQVRRAPTNNRNLGTELDLNMKYQWNKEVKIDGTLGYLFGRSYYEGAPKNSLLLQLRMVAEF